MTEATTPTEPQSPTRPRFAPATAAFVRCANAVAGVSRTVRFNWNGQPAELSFTAAPGPLACQWSAVVALGDRRLNVTCERLPESSHLSADLAGIQLEDLPAELACGVVEACFEPVLEQLARAGVGIALEQLEAANGSLSLPSERLGWTIQRGTAPELIQGYAWGEPEALEYLAGLMSRVPAARQTDCAQVPMTFSVAAAALVLPLASLRDVECGDVLLVDTRDYRASGACQIFGANGLIAAGTVKDRLVTLTQMSAPPQSSAPANGSPAVGPDQLPIQLQFVVGETTLTVADLSALKAGFTFELPASAGASVVIRANGQNIGRGEIVEIGDHLGVRVTEFGSV